MFHCYISFLSFCLERFSDFLIFYPSQIWEIALTGIIYSHEYFWSHVTSDCQNLNISLKTVVHRNYYVTWDAKIIIAPTYIIAGLQVASPPRKIASYSLVSTGLLLFLKSGLIILLEPLDSRLSCQQLGNYCTTAGAATSPTLASSTAVLNLAVH